MAAPQRASAAPTGGGIERQNLGPANIGFPVMSGELVGDMMYVGSRNLKPTRVAGLHVPSGKVTKAFTLGNGLFTQGLANHGNLLYAGVTHDPNKINVYRCEIDTGVVTGIGKSYNFVRDMCTAPDGTLYIVGGNETGHYAGPPPLKYDPATGSLTVLAVPEPHAQLSRAVFATDSTVYYGCGSPRAGGRGAFASIFTVDASSGTVTEITPSVIAGDDTVTSLALLGDYLVATTGEHAVGQRVSDGVWHTITTSDGAPIGITGGIEFSTTASGILVGASPLGVHAVDPTTWVATKVADPLPGVTVWGAGTRGEQLVAASAAGVVWAHDLATGAEGSQELVSAGADGAPQVGMSIAAGDGRVYVGGNNTVAEHVLAASTVKNMVVPGEVKDMVVHDEVLYMGVYKQHGVWEYNPADGKGPRHMADLPEGDNRPLDVAWDDANGLFALGMQTDAGVGDLCLYDPEDQSVETLHAGRVRAVAPAHGLIYIGREDGVVQAWRPGVTAPEWSIKLDYGVNSMVCIGRKLYGTYSVRRFFVLDVKPSRAPQQLHDAQLDQFGRNATLTVNRGMIYGASPNAIFRVNPSDYAITVLADNLGAQWYGDPHLAVDEENWIYTLSGTDLIRVRDKTPKA